MKVGKLPVRHKASMDDNMIPLINIVFLMLIFFMVAGHIQQSEPVKVTLPNSVSDKRAPEEAVTILVSVDGTIALDQKLIKQEALSAFISKQFAAAVDKQAFILFVKVDGQLPVEKLREILSLIKQAGIKRVSLATQQ